MFLSVLLDSATATIRYQTIAMGNNDDFFDQFVPSKTIKKFCFKKIVQQSSMNAIGIGASEDQKQTVKIETDRTSQQQFNSKFTLSTKKLASTNYVKCNKDILLNEKELFKDKTTISSGSDTVAHNDKNTVHTSVCNVGVPKNCVSSVVESSCSRTTALQEPKNKPSTKKFTFKKSNFGVVNNLDSLINQTKETGSVVPQKVECTLFNSELSKNEVTAVRTVNNRSKNEESEVRLCDKSDLEWEIDAFGDCDSDLGLNDVNLSEKTYSTHKNEATVFVGSSFREPSFNSVSNASKTLNDTIDLSDIDWNSEIMIEDVFKTDNCSNYAASSSVSAGNSEWNSSVFEEKKSVAESQTNPFKDRKDDSGEFLVFNVIINVLRLGCGVFINFSSGKSRVCFVLGFEKMITKLFLV